MSNEKLGRPEFWISCVMFRNCMNCSHCKFNKGWTKADCVMGHWIAGDFGEKARNVNIRPGKWNRSAFLETMAEECLDYDPMGGLEQ